MIRAFVAIAVVAISTDAARVGTENQDKSKTPFVASCEDLQVTLRSRVTAVQALLNSYQDATGISSFGQAQITMRVFGVVRTLRRARNCQWVLDGDSEDIEQARSVVQSVLAQNPCAEAAMAEMTPEAFESAANELQPLQRAMIVLMSESCEVPKQDEAEEAAEVEDEDAMEHGLVVAEEETQDHIDELFEQAMLESESLAEGSFVQMDAQARAGTASVLRIVGVAFFSILFAMVCMPIGAIIGAVIGIVFCVALGASGICGRQGQHFMGLIVGGFFGGLGGLGVCAFNLAQYFLPDLFQNHSQTQYPQPTGPFKPMVLKK